MKLQDVINEMQKEIDTINTFIELTGSSNTIRYGRRSKVESISKYLSRLEILNGEDLKRDEKSFCPICGCNKLQIDEHSVVCLNLLCDYNMAKIFL